MLDYSTSISITHVLNLTSIVFCIGLLGIVLNRKNLLITLMSIELMLLAINLNFIAFSVFHDNVIGQLFAMFVLAIAAAESAVGLSLITIFYKLIYTIKLKSIKKKKR